MSAGGSLGIARAETELRSRLAVEVAPVDAVKCGDDSAVIASPTNLL